MARASSSKPISFCKPTLELEDEELENDEFQLEDPCQIEP